MRKEKNCAAKVPWKMSCCWSSIKMVIFIDGKLLLDSWQYLVETVSVVHEPDFKTNIFCSSNERVRMKIYLHLLINSIYLCFFIVVCYFSSSHLIIWYRQRRHYNNFIFEISQDIIVLQMTQYINIFETIKKKFLFLGTTTTKSTKQHIK